MPWDSNGPFAAEQSRGTKLPNWRANVPVHHLLTSDFVPRDRPAAKSPLPWQKEVSMATLKGPTAKGTTISARLNNPTLTKIGVWEGENLVIKFAKWPHFRLASKQKQGNLKEFPPIPSKHKGQLLIITVSIILI